MSIEIGYRIVDVFSERPLAGNALCVVVDPCPDPVQPAIAREVNLSETTFPVVTGDDRYEMRIFTPADELPFAGHPSLGTAWVLGPNRWTQTTSGATIVVEADATGATMELPDPPVTAADQAAGAAAGALGLPGAEGAFLADSGGMHHLVVPTESPLDHLAPDLDAVAAVARSAGARSICALRRLDDATLHMRVFLPGIGVPEDPGTGSAAGPAALVARRRWGTDVDVTILQGAEMGRPCRIEVHAEEGALRVGGRVASSASGRFTL
ncbi:MAG TPA: PhzF family phenazine biosynthesis protein [Acidimicrobiales bacterium]|nr:PhzF family phenazine biosynthesis protein [Acidimicrobiales bacterium]